MKKINKHLKEKSKRFKEYKKKKSFTNLKNDIKNLPQELQMMIFMMAISSANSDNFNYHKPKFYKTLKCLNVHFDNKTKFQTNDGLWYKYEYDLYKKEGATHSISGMKYYHIEHKDIYPTHKKMYKDLKFNYDGSWKSRPTFLEKLKYEPYDIFEGEHNLLSVINVTNRFS
jgi:hypothetical protein